MSRKSALKVKSEETEPADNEKEKASTIKPKASGKLDWSKAKKSSEGSKQEKGVKVKKEQSPVRSLLEKTPAKSESESPQDSSKVRTMLLRVIPSCV